MKPPGAVGTLLRALGRRDSADTPPAPHSFREKALRRGGACAGCREPLGPQGLVCRVCKVASHAGCEAKVTSPCEAPPPPELPAHPPQRRNTTPARRGERLGSTRSLNGARQRSTLPRPPGAGPPPAPPALELAHAAERILCLRFPARLREPRYRRLLREAAAALRARHGRRYALFNLSEKRRDIAHLNPQVQEFGWPDLHAPPLDKLCAICKAMEAWLGGHPRHVAVLHCRGGRGKLGVVVAAYMHYSGVTASAAQALDTLSMRQFCEKAAGALQPSQRRCIEQFGGLLGGTLPINSSPLFLHHVLLPPLPAFQPGADFQPFLKIYQALQLVYTSGVYSTPGPQSLCVTLEPALLLKGDVMVTCYRRLPRGREALFRAQFHTCGLRGARLRLRKGELDRACGDDRFPPDASVELIFSSGPEKIEGWEPPRPPPVDYGVGDPAVRWDSYEGFNLRHQDSLEELAQAGSPHARAQRPWDPQTPGGGNDSPPPPDPPRRQRGRGRAPPRPPAPPHRRRAPGAGAAAGGLRAAGGGPGGAGDPHPGG